MRQTLLVAVVVAACPTTADAFPPVPPRKPVVVRAAVNPNVSPLGSGSLTIMLTRGGDRVEVWTTTGIGSSLDFDIRGAAGTRLTRPFLRAQVSSPFGADFLAGTFGDRPLVLKPAVAADLALGDLKPGKYRCRVRFRYKDYEGVSDWVEFELTAAQIKEHLDEISKPGPG